MRSGANCIERENFFFLRTHTCYGFQQLILSGVVIEYNGQLIHRASHGSINVYNSSTTTLKNSGMCSNGIHRYHSFSVKIYFANITGSFRIALVTQFYTSHNSRYKYEAGIIGDIHIHSGKLDNYKVYIHNLWIICTNKRSCMVPHAGLANKVYADRITQWHFDIINMSMSLPIILIIWLP